MEVVIVERADQIGPLVSSMIVDLVRRRPRCVLGLATGDSPLPIYRALIAAQRRGDVSFAETSAVTLDEYVGLAPDHAAAYRQVIRSVFVDHVDLPATALHSPDVHASDLESACRAYESRIRELGGVDLQLLGIGADGHIGFNEPGSSLASRTRIKTLHPRTRDDNSRFFDSVDEVPHHVVTQGIGTVLDARHAVLVASGSHKRDAVAAMVEGPVTAFVPASVLQMHPHVTVVVDEASAASLRLADYYRFAHEHKPAWQAY